MRLGRVTTGAGAALVVNVDGEVRPVTPHASDLSPLIESEIDGFARSLRVGDALVEEPRWAAPLAPGKIIAVGLNYRDHAAESSASVPDHPLVFAKFPSSVTGPYDPILIDPSLTERVDWEVELAVVVGRRMRNVAANAALDYVFGYTVANDISARDVQFSDGQWTRGKSFDTFCPLGPVVVTADELSSPDDLQLRTRVNGETVQADSTASMIFGVAELLAFCSHSFTLDPGDVLLSGTPSGCGEFMDPPRRLIAGDIVESEIVGIGTLRNPVVASNMSQEATRQRHDRRDA